MGTAIDIRRADVFLERRKILSDINWRVEHGEHWFVLGSNGAGKTTLVKMLMGFVWPAYGAEVHVLGNRYGTCDLAQVRKKISWVSPFLQSWTSSRWKAVEVVLSGLDATVGLFRKNVSPEEMNDALAVMRKLDCADRAEQAFDRLSSGEQVKVLIARALISRPELLILDEACVHLDMKSREFLLETVDALAKEEDSPTIIFISQRIEDISTVFTKGVIMKGGRIVSCGSREYVLTEENLSGAFDMKIALKASADGRLWPFPVH